MVARYEGSRSGQWRSVTLLHWYLGQGNREEKRKEKNKKANEVMKFLKLRLGGALRKEKDGGVVLVSAISSALKMDSLRGLEEGRLGWGGWGGGAVNRRQPSFTATRWLHKIGACMHACMRLLLNMEE